MSARAALPLAVLAFAVAASSGQQPPPPPAVEADMKAPYLWRVVVQVRPHPLLTSAFRDQLRRDLVAALQPGIGTFGTVDVIDLAEVPRDRWDPLWQEFDDKGFAALANPRDLTGVKTHFLRVEFRDGAFQLESRQHDGFTGLASPQVRKQTVRVPELVGRAAGLMLDRDFGLAGTIEPMPGSKGEEVRVRFKGGELGPLDRLVRPGDILAVAAIRKTTRPGPPPARTATGKLIAPAPGSAPPPAFTPAPRDYTYLRVAEVPKEGMARCQVLTRYAAPFPPGRDIAGYRCMKIATTDAPLTVKLVGGDGAAHKTASVVNVRATDGDFNAPAEPKDNLDFRDGLFRSNRALKNVALITVAVGPTKAEKFPVPVLNADPVTLRFELDPKAEERAVYERAVLAAAGRAADARKAQLVCFEAVGKLIETKRNADALARAKAGHQSADAAEKTLSEELTQLKAESEKSPAAGNLLNNLDQQLAALRKGNEVLAGHVATLEGVVKQENDPASVARDVQAEALVTRIKILLEQGEVDQAIVAYDQLIQLRPNDPKVKEWQAKLREEWKPKSDEHAKARDYLLKTWPTLATVQDVKDSLPALRNNIDACKKAGDKYAFRKLLTVIGTFNSKLNDLTANLDPNSEGDRKTLDDARTVREVVGKVEQELIDWLKATP